MSFKVTIAAYNKFHPLNTPKIIYNCEHGNKAESVTIASIIRNTLTESKWLNYYNVCSLNAYRISKIQKEIIEKLNSNNNISKNFERLFVLDGSKYEWDRYEVIASVTTLDDLNMIK